MTPAISSSSSCYELQYAQILAANHGGLLVPFKTVAKLLGMRTQSLRNKIYRGTFKLDPVQDGNRLYFRSTDLAAYISGSQPTSSIKMCFDEPERRRRGRPTDSPEVKAAKAKAAKAKKVGVIYGRQ